MSEIEKFYGNLFSQMKQDDDYQYFQEKAIRLEKNGNYNQAIECYKKALDLKPDDVHSYLSLIFVYYFQDKTEELIEIFDKIKYLDWTLHQDIDSFKLFCDLGQTFSNKKLYTKSIECYQKALDIQPEKKEINQKIKKILNKLVFVD